MISPEYDRPSFIHIYEASRIEVPYFLSFMFVVGKGKTKRLWMGFSLQSTNWCMLYRFQRMFVRCCLHMYVTDAATFRLLSDSFVPVARAFFGHAFTVLEYMKSVVVQNWPGKTCFLFSHVCISWLSHLRTAESFWTSSSSSVLNNPQTLHHSWNLSLSIEPDGSLPRSQQPTTWPYQTPY